MNFIIEWGDSRNW